MSYILEALKKSEQERKRGDVPDLQTLHLPMPDLPRTRSWPYVVIVLLLVSLSFVVGWILPGRQQQVMQVENAPSEHNEVEAPVSAGQSARTEQVTPPKPLTVAPAPVQSSPSEPVREDAPVSVSPVQKVERRQPVTEPPSLDITSVPHLSEMPQLVQQAVPDMSFAGHVYSSNAAQRSVIINGRSMSEGDQLLQGLTVEQITAKGIVFNYRGQLFRMDILQDWSFDY